MSRSGRDLVGNRRRFVADPDLVACALAAAHRLGGGFHTGTVVSGNQAIFSTNRKRWLQKTFSALAVDMETAAVAQVAVSYGLPWVAIRAISDQADDSQAVDYRRLVLYLDSEVPIGRQRLARWFYLSLHPTSRGRLRNLQRGLTYASKRAALVAETMMQM